MFKSWVLLAFRWRYTTVGLMVAFFILAVGMLAGGRVGFEFFPTPEPENISAYVTFAPGTPRDMQIKATEKIEATLYDTELRLLAQHRKAAPDDGQGIAPRRIVLVLPFAPAHS